MCGVQERWALEPLRRTLRLSLTGVVAGCAIAADQFAVSSAERDLHHPVHLFGPLGLNLVYNSGSGFSLLEGSPVVAGVIALCVLVAFAWVVVFNSSVIVAMAGGAVIGGGISNLLDRVSRTHAGAVVDYITLSHWPTFNVADACITLGLVVVGLRLLFDYAKKADHS